MENLPPLEIGEVAGWKRRLQIAVRAASLGVYDWNLRTDAFVYSTTAKEIFGLPPDGEVTRDRLRSLLHPDDVAQVAAKAERARDPAFRDEEGYRYRIFRADTGALRWIEAFGDMVFDHGVDPPVPLHYIGTLRDITEQVCQQETLRRQEARLRLAIEASGIAVWELDLADGSILHSPELNRLCGFPPDARPTLDEFRARYAPGERERLDLLGAEARARGETRIATEVHHVWPDGTERWLSMRAQLAPGETSYDGRIIGVLVDITEQKRREQDQALLLGELKHRIKNSFAIAQSIINQTLRGSGVSAETRRSLADRLQAMAVAHDEIAKGPWAGASLLATVARVCSAFGGDWNHRISVTGDDIDLPPRTVLSFSLLFHELLTNATKYGALAGDEGSVAVRVERADRGGEGGAVAIEWKERRSLPLTTRPGSPGFGTRLMDTVIADLQGTIERDFGPHGLSCRIHVPDNRLAEA